MEPNANEDLNVGLDCYDPENRVFPRIPASSGQPTLSKRDILQILKWKLGRIKDSNSETVSDANMSSINNAVQAAGTLGSEIDALKSLCRVPGIGLAAASAILTVCYPQKFTIIDQRVLETLDLFPSTLLEDERTDYKTDDWTPDAYVNEYLPRVVERQQSWGCSLRDADRALWGLSVNERIKGIIAKSSSVKP